MAQLKWRIRNVNGHYTIAPMDREGTIMITNDITLSTIFGPHTRDYMDGYCAALNALLDGGFTPVPAVHITEPSKTSV